MKLGQFLGIVFLCAVLSFMTARIVSLSTQVSKTEAQAAQVHKAACAYRASLREDARKTRKFVKDHPEGLTLGTQHYSRSYLLNQANIQQKRADSFKGLLC